MPVSYNSLCTFIVFISRAVKSLLYSDIYLILNLILKLKKVNQKDHLIEFCTSVILLYIVLLKYSVVEN